MLPSAFPKGPRLNPIRVRLRGVDVIGRLLRHCYRSVRDGSPVRRCIGESIDLLANTSMDPCKLGARPRACWGCVFSAVRSVGQSVLIDSRWGNYLSSRLPPGIRF